MAGSFLSSNWYRVAGLKPRLGSHARVHRHRYRGDAWYVIEDPAGGQSHRFTPAAYMVVGRLDGRRTVGELWEDTARQLGEDAPSQDDIVQLLGQLHSADLLVSGMAPDLGEVLERRRKRSGQIWKQNAKSPMSFRIPLFDPDPFLTRTLPLVRPLTGPLGVVLWLGMVAWALVLAAQNWDALTYNLADRIFAAENLLIMALVYPPIKALHELGHGYVAKRYGAEVRETGIMFLVFFPVPYVDASAASAIRSKWQRAGVAAAGIIVETCIAALALYAWTVMEPGLARAVMFNIMLVAGLSTVLVNGNPLLRFDGYYVLADLIEVPNLATRANKFWGHWVERYLLGGEGMRDFPATWGERVWFLIYAPAAYVYRIAILIWIAFFVIGALFFLGVVLAIWTVTMGLIWPAAKALWHVLTHARLRRRRRRAVSVLAGAAGAVVAVVMLVPLPLTSLSQGVVWLPEQAQVRPGTDGFVAEVLVAPGAAVVAGEPLLRLDDPTLAVRLRMLEAERAAVQIARQAARVRDLVEAEVLAVRIAHIDAQIARERERADALTVRAPADGRFAPVTPLADAAGRYLAQGALVGHVLPEGQQTARIVVPQADADLVQNRLLGMSLAYAHAPGEGHPVFVQRAVPGGAMQLPSAALSMAFGGPHAVDPGDPEGLRTLTRVFQLDVALPPAAEPPPYGARVWVKFDHGTEALGRQIYRRARQTVLARLDA